MTITQSLHKSIQESPTGFLQWKVGRFTITSIPELGIVSDPAFFFGDKVDPEAVREIAKKNPWIDEHSLVSKEGFINWKIQALVVDDGTYRIAVDTCVGNDKALGEVEFSKLSTGFLARLEAVGYPRSSITHVVCTHLHFDHVGWNTILVNGKWVPTFPNARYIFAKAEYDFWKDSTPSWQTDDAPKDETFTASVKPIYDAGLADLVGPDHVIAPGVSLEPTPGHTPCHVSVVIQDGDSKAVITGDMTHSPIQVAVPTHSPRFDSDPKQSVQTRVAAFERWCAAKSLVIGSHFTYPTAGYLKKVGDQSFAISFEGVKRVEKGVLS
ncbi:Metallo-hydrolase/oxidoreductase [Gonapodya prolifera JEL478]|uniref:Metallo-hydrolase/oxidoreductase n=1 Tax=Gonapodya prolifera (strain JEL478) TaxID=1344416 RepID=A0A139AAP6_GONPJ|nr:Metallo-hydrolase/oxidoreductase [Gonapodya prolifera JEL478]|eukprot:KXS13744.1 Metallo-hydrolase/oxidoreductase [Gonapodya prolifera JEL478]